MNESNQYNRTHYNEYTVLGRISSSEEHVVVDARTKRRGAVSDPKKDKRNEKTRQSSRGKTLLTVLITVFAFSLTLIGADLISGRSTLSQYVSLFTGKTSDGASSYYAVYAMKTDDMAIAYKNAASIRAEGGAGYVLKDQETFYVILSVYEEESDAKKVADKEANYAVYTLRAPLLDLEREDFSCMSDSIDLSVESYRVLYEAANNLASGKYGEEDMIHAIKKHREKIIATQEKYAENIRGKETTPQIEYKVLLAEIRGAFDNLISGSSALVADARYYSVMILHSYSLFAQKYAK